MRDLEAHRFGSPWHRTMLRHRPTQEMRQHLCRAQHVLSKSRGACIIGVPYTDRCSALCQSGLQQYQGQRTTKDSQGNVRWMCVRAQCIGITSYD